MSTPPAPHTAPNPNRIRHYPNGGQNLAPANHRHSKSTSNISGTPKKQQQGTRHTSSQYKHGSHLTKNSYPSHSDNELPRTHSEPITTIPSTPPRHNSYNNDSTEKKTRSKRRGQKRPKDLNTAAAKADAPGQLPIANIPQQPQTAKPFATPGKHYAGPTFHHSPAPSALPMPSFFSKSVPSTPNGPSLSNMMTSSDSSDSDSVKDEPKEESPLAKLFRADSEERAAKKRREVTFDDNPFKSRSTSNLPNDNSDLMFSMDNEGSQKLKDKANALKEILLQHAPELPSSPSPKRNVRSPGTPTGTPTKSYIARPRLNENVPAIESPKKIMSRATDKDPKAIEDYLRWALKIDTPTTGVRG